MATSEEIYDYVFNNCHVHKTGFINGKYYAYITMLGYEYIEYASNQLEARAKLANELSKSIYIQKNFKK